MRCHLEAGNLKLECGLRKHRGVEMFRKVKGVLLAKTVKALELLRQLKGDVKSLILAIVVCKINSWYERFQ